MENKKDLSYQEALDIIANFPGIDDSHIMGKYVEKLQELVDKEKPVKPNFIRRKPYDHSVYYCGCCGRKIVYVSAYYCHMCSQKINWEKEE